MYTNWRDLIRPRNLVVDRDSLSDRYGKFVAEPLERGFGITLGNALRRVLLSSLEGTSVCAVRIADASHEFTSIPDITEDVTDIILNIKQLALKLNDVESTKIQIKAEGPRVITAGDIDCGAHVEVLNKDLHLLTLDSKAKVSMTLNVEEGKGYVPALKQKNEAPLGTIFID